MCVHTGHLLCLAGAALGFLGLLAWITGTHELIALSAGEPVMVPNTGLALLLLGTAALLAGSIGDRRWTPWVVGAAAVLVWALGIATLVQYGLDVDLSIDRILPQPPSGRYPGRPSPMVAFTLSLLAPAVLFFDLRLRSRVRPADWLLLAGGLMALIALLGHLFGASILYRLTHAPITGVSVLTALSLLAISMGLLLTRPRVGVVRFLISRGPGGVLLRRLAPATLLGPPVLGVVLTRAFGVHGDAQTALLLAILAAVIIVGGLGLLTVTAASLNRTDEALQASREQTRSLIEHAPVGIFIANTDGHYTDVNSAACEMLGYSRNEILSRSITDLIPAEEVERLWEARKELLGGGVQISDWTLRRKDGTPVPVEVNATILPGGLWLAIARDVTERNRRRREQELLAQAGPVLAQTLDYEAVLSSIAELVVHNLADVCIVDIVEDDGQVRRLKVASRDPSKTWLCRTLTNLPLDRSRPHLMWLALHERRATLMQDFSPTTLEFLAQSEEHLDALRALEAHSAITLPLIAHGKLVGAMAFVSSTPVCGYEADDLRLATDLAQRAALSIENARLYRAAQRAIRAREDILGVVAHDLRTPLNGLVMYAEILERSGNNSEIGLDEPSTVIKSVVSRMNRLIRDLLDVSLIEAERLPVDVRRLSPETLVPALMASHQSVAASSQIELTVNIDSSLPDVLADYDRLLQVLENLLGNALKFTRPGGSVTLCASHRNDEVVFAVSDTGTGIAPEHLEHLFDRFWQAERAGRHGTGLGLTIAKGIVEAHHGRMWVRSKVGEGTTFSFTLPVAPPLGDAPFTPGP